MVQQYPWLLNETFSLIGGEFNQEINRDEGYYTWLTWELLQIKTEDNNLFWILKLLKAGADPNIKTMDPNGNVGNALRTYMEVLTIIDKKIDLKKPNHAESHLQVVKNLLQYHVQVDPDMNDEDISPFQLSVYMLYRHPTTKFFKDLMDLLINSGANINHRDYDGNNILHKLIQMSSIDKNKNAINILKLLLQLGVNINEQNDVYKETPLHIAVQQNKLNIIKFLLANRAAIDIKNSGDKTPFDYCKNDECRNLFRSYSTRKWPAKWGREEWNPTNKQQYFMKDIIPKLHGYLQLDDCRPENIEKIATLKFGIDTEDVDWKSFSDKKKCWILKNMLSGYNYNQANINWDAAVMQGRLNKLDFGGDEPDGAFEGLSSDFTPIIDIQITDAKKRIEDQRRDALDKKRGLFY
jgi:hypothetical protein